MRKRNFQYGFTLLEILVALFIFSILSVMLASALNRVMSNHGRTEYKASRLRDLQIAMLIFSRDIEQAVNRPISDSSGKEVAAFKGSAREIEFTHTGRAHSYSQTPQSSLVRVKYVFINQEWWRQVWPVLDQAPQTKVRQRLFLSDIISGRFEYLDKQGKFHNEWRGSIDLQEALPRAVRITLDLKKWGKISQVYLISSGQSEQPKPSTKEGGNDE